METKHLEVIDLPVVGEGLGVRCVVVLRAGPRAARAVREIGVCSPPGTLKLG